MPTPAHDAWHFPRPVLAKSYLDLFSAGPGGPLTLFSPRRTGKTHFLIYDLVPAAEKRKYFAVYVDLWQDRVESTQALLFALDQAIEELTLPKTKLRSRLATTVKKISALGASVDFGEEPSRKRPDSPYLQIDFLMQQIVRLAKRPVLLLLDEVQQLADARDGVAIVSALRSSITKVHGRVFVLFTGSSEQRLREMFARAKAPLYEFSSHIVFPLLGDDFVHHIAQKHAIATKRTLNQSALREAFRAFDRRPKPFVDMVVDLMKQGETDVERAMARHLAARDHAEDFSGLWRSLRPLEQQILRRIALGENLTSAQALKEYGKAAGRARVSTGSVDYALKKLQEQHLVVSLGERGAHRLESERLSTWIRRHAAK
jgi:uncharacterized protein